MKKQKLLKFWKKINIDIYEAEVIYCFNMDKKGILAIAKQLKFQELDSLGEMLDHGLKDVGGKTYGFTGFHKWSGTVFVVINDFDFSATSYGDLVHETFHAAEIILDNRGIELVGGSEEAYAYMIGYLSTEIFKITFQKWNKT